MGVDPGLLVHAHHREHEQVPRVRQHHRERPHPAVLPRGRIHPGPQIAVIHLGLVARVDRRPPHDHLPPAHLGGEMGSHVTAKTGHAGLQAVLISQPLVDHRHRHHPHQGLDPLPMNLDLTPRRLTQPGIHQRREPLPHPLAPLLLAQRRAARDQPGRHRRSGVLGHRRPVHAQAGRHLLLRPARIPVLQDLDHVDHAERPPSQCLPPSQATETSVRGPRAELADRGGAELPDRNAPHPAGFRDRQHGGSWSKRSPRLAMWPIWPNRPIPWASGAANVTPKPTAPTLVCYASCSKMGICPRAGSPQRSSWSGESGCACTRRWSI